MGSQDKQKFAPPGQMVDIGGFRLHAMVGGQGTPAVLLEPGLGGFALQYAHIQPAVAAFTRVLAYDRAGQGWSDCSPNPRTPANLAGELKALLGKLDIQPPYVLVGHSFGGLVARFYAGFHPEEVAGVILVDSSDVEPVRYLPKHGQNGQPDGHGSSPAKIRSATGPGQTTDKAEHGECSQSAAQRRSGYLHSRCQPAQTSRNACWLSFPSTASILGRNRKCRARWGIRPWSWSPPETASAVKGNSAA